ncbi:hypothetical protein R1Z14_002775, partial [Clostridium perfringens]|nr:hypothetical protein [Clostridium perfringens]
GTFMRVSDIGGVNVSVNLGGNNFNKKQYKKNEKNKNNSTDKDPELFNKILEEKMKESKK